MPNKHKTPPVSLRLPAGRRAWVKDYAAKTGQAVNAVVVLAVTRLRASVEAGEEPDKPGKEER